MELETTIQKEWVKSYDVTITQSVNRDYFFINFSIDTLCVASVKISEKQALYYSDQLQIKIF